MSLLNWLGELSEVHHGLCRKSVLALRQEKGPKVVESQKALGGLVKWGEVWRRFTPCRCSAPLRLPCSEWIPDCASPQPVWALLGLRAAPPARSPSCTASLLRSGFLRSHPLSEGRFQLIIPSNKRNDSVCEVSDSTDGRRPALFTHTYRLLVSYCRDTLFMAHQLPHPQLSAPGRPHVRFTDGTRSLCQRPSCASVDTVIPAGVPVHVKGLSYAEGESQ